MSNNSSASAEAVKFLNQVIIIAVIVVVVLGASIYGGCAIAPRYKVWKQGKEGEAILAHAKYSREVAVAEAQAKMESAVLLAKAEVSRAEGVAQANEIIGKSLKDNESYLHYLWITEVAGKDIDKTVVYIPTEANIPILEASRSITR